MNNSDQQPNTKTPSAGRRRSAVDGPPFPPSCAAPVELESKFLFNAEDFEDDGGSSSSEKRRSVFSSFHPPASPLDDGGPLALQAPFRPQSRRLFEEDRHPLSTHDVFPPNFSVQSLRDLVISYVFDGDFFSPLKILPFIEYSPGGIISLVLTADQMAFHPRLNQSILLRSLHDCVLFTPPPVTVRAEYGLDFGPNTMLRALPSACFENLNVLYVILNTKFETFCAALSKLEDLLRNVKVLIVQCKKTLPEPDINDELFVFYFRNTKDIVSAVANTLATMKAYDISKDLDQLLDVFAVENEQQVLLTEAVIVVDDGRFPAIKHLLDHPICRWVFRLNSEQVVSSVAELSKVQCIFSPLIDVANTTEPKVAIGEYDQLTWWSYFNPFPPVDGFAHYRLSNLHWSPIGHVVDFPGFSGFPNLHRLRMLTYSEWSTVLRLDETKRLKHLEVRNFARWEVDVGPDPVSLDVLHLADFRGKMTRIEHLFIRDLEPRGVVQPELLHQLCRQTENVHFEINDSNPTTVNWSYAFAHAKHLRCWRPNEGFYDIGGDYSFTLLATHSFLRLELLHLENSTLIFSPSFFPVLRKLILDMCHVLVPFNVDEESKEKEELHRLHFAGLEECTLQFCRIDRADSDEAKLEVPEEDNHFERIQYAFCAPNLKLLSYCNNIGSVALFLDEVSCPRLGSFEWSGPDFAELPFDVNVSLNTPLFPELHSLSLCVTERKVDMISPSPRLSERLSIAKVSHLSLLEYAYVIDLADLTLQCRWAEFSEEVVKKCSGYDPMDGDMDSKAYLKGAGVSMMKKMPRIELFMIRDIYVYPDAVPIVPKSFLQ